jgi:hypothetical protein
MAQSNIVAVNMVIPAKAQQTKTKAKKSPKKLPEPGFQSNGQPEFVEYPCLAGWKHVVLNHEQNLQDFKEEHVIPAEESLESLINDVSELRKKMTAARSKQTLPMESVDFLRRERQQQLVTAKKELLKSSLFGVLVAVATTICPLVYSMVSASAHEA